MPYTGTTKQVAYNLTIECERSELSHAQTLTKFSLIGFICPCVRQKFDKEPCSKAGHASISSRKIVRVHVRTAVKENLTSN